MAGRANTGRVAVIDTPPSVAKGRSCPRRCCMTSRASSRKDCWRRFVDGVRRGVVIRRVAAITRRRQRRVVAVYMATGASHRRVGARQRKRCGAVIELAVCPQDRVVAQLARGREPCLDVIHRSCRGVVVVQMTGNASSIRTRQVVVVVDMAVGADARGDSVRVRERETRGGVIELPVCPQDRVVAALASCGKA